MCTVIVSSAKISASFNGLAQAGRAPLSSTDRQTLVPEGCSLICRLPLVDVDSTRCWTGDGVLDLDRTESGGLVDLRLRQGQPAPHACYYGIFCLQANTLTTRSRRAGALCTGSARKCAACSRDSLEPGQPLLIWWRRDLGLGASKNRRICNHYVFKVVSQNLADRQRVTRVVTRVSGGTAERRTGWNVCPCAERRKVGEWSRRCITPSRGGHSCWCPSSWTVRKSSEKCRSVWVCSSSLWTSSLFDPETRAAEERRSCLGWKSCYCRAASSPSHSEKRSFPKPGILFRVLFIWRYKSIYYAYPGHARQTTGAFMLEWSRPVPAGAWPGYWSTMIYVCKAESWLEMTVESTWRFLLVARQAATLPIWGCGTPSLRLGNFPSWRDFPFERANQSAFIFTGPQAQIPSSPYQQGLGLVRG